MGTYAGGRLATSPSRVGRRARQAPGPQREGGARRRRPKPIRSPSTVRSGDLVVLQFPMHASTPMTAPSHAVDRGKGPRDRAAPAATAHDGDGLDGVPAILAGATHPGCMPTAMLDPEGGWPGGTWQPGGPVGHPGAPAAGAVVTVDTVVGGLRWRGTLPPCRRRRRGGHAISRPVSTIAVSLTRAARSGDLAHPAAPSRCGSRAVTACRYRRPRSRSVTPASWSIGGS